MSVFERRGYRFASRKRAKTKERALSCSSQFCDDGARPGPRRGHRSHPMPQRDDRRRTGGMHQHCAGANDLEGGPPRTRETRPSGGSSPCRGTRRGGRAAIAASHQRLGSLPRSRVPGRHRAGEGSGRTRLVFSYLTEKTRERIRELETPLLSKMALPADNFDRLGTCYINKRLLANQLPSTFVPLPHEPPHYPMILTRSPYRRLARCVPAA